MDEVFKAINDPGRRILLDKLFEHDGQSLGELCEHLPGMTRYGVMNHLRILEEANLVSTVKRGRSKFHYLNPVPIKLILDRWISKYAAPRIAAIAGIKATAESGGARMEPPAHIYKSYIRASVDAVWNAITDGDQTVQYFYGTRVKSDWQVGSSMNYYDGSGALVSESEIISIDPPNRIESTFLALWDPEITAEGPCRTQKPARDRPGPPCSLLKSEANTADPLVVAANRSARSG